MQSKPSIACIGAGYVGGPTMAIIAEKCPDVKVTVVDINQQRIDAWNSQKLPIFEPGLAEIVEHARGRNLFFSTDIKTAIREANIIFLCVNTPTKSFGHGAGMTSDLQYWEKAARQILDVAEDDKIIVEKSTLPVRTSTAIEQILNSNEKGIHFEVVSNPEFLAEGTAIQDLLQPDRVLIGGHKSESGLRACEMLVELYARWVPRSRIITTNLWSSELAKLTANAFLAQRISSINSISAICERTGADIEEVAHAIGCDSRIGPKFLKAGIGFGGSCFKKDVLNLAYLADYYGLSEVARYWKSVVDINEWQTHRVTESLLHTLFHTLAGKRIAVFGFAFKSNTGDTRETPANIVVRDLLAEHAYPVVTDPKALENAKLVLQDVQQNVEFEADPYNAVKHSDAVIVCTEWTCYAELDWSKIYKNMNKPAILFDGRNILNAEELRKIGFTVKAIGKASE